MSQENVEIVKAGFEAWNAGDMDAFRELYDPDLIMRAMEGWPEPGPYVGREAVMRWFVRQGRIFYNEFFWDHAEALETLGLSE
jgi:ketosteroid isomerase-like protein